MVHNVTIIKIRKTTFIIINGSFKRQRDTDFCSYYFTELFKDNSLIGVNYNFKNACNHLCLKLRRL